MDIYLSLNKNDLISQIDSTESIQNELEIFKEKTGVVIDEYGKTHLYLDHIKLLADLIKTPNKWKLIFDKAIDLNSGLIIEGD